MAGLFCQELVNNRASTNPIYAGAVAIAGPLLAGIDFTKVPQTGLPAASRPGLVSRLFMQFLGRAPSTQESADLVQAMTDMEGGLTAGGPTQAGATLAARAAVVNDTRDVVIGACTSVLGNLEFVSN
jgi:hypothetical protein